MTSPERDIYDDVVEDTSDSAQPSAEPATKEADKQEETTDKRVTLRCSDAMNSLSHPEGAFPTVTREGTEMSAAEAKEAKAAAKAARIFLITVGGRNN